MPSIKSGLNARGSIATQNLGGPGPIQFEESQLDSTYTDRYNYIVDYIRLRLGDGLVDVELDKEHYDLAIHNALNKYRQRANNSVEESYCFLELLSETQEYILPREIVQVRQVFRRGIGSMTGNTASQFEPFASGYLNTYMLVAGRVGGLLNYEMFVHYQEQAMKMFGGHINFTWNPATRKLTLVRKITETNKRFIRLSSLSSSGTAVGSVITLITYDDWAVSVGDNITIRNCSIVGYNGLYTITTSNRDTNTFTIVANQTLGATSVTLFDLRRTEVYSSITDDPAEIVLLHTYNYKPNSMLLNDHMISPWIQEYAYAFAKGILGEARSKFAQLAGPQGGMQLNGTALITESREEIQKLEEDLKTYVDGSMPLTWVIG
jgi:hypothetical protein